MLVLFKADVNISYFLLSFNVVLGKVLSLAFDSLLLDLELLLPLRFSGVDVHFGFDISLTGPLVPIKSEVSVGITYFWFIAS